MSAGRNYLMLRGRREGDKKGGGRREEGGRQEGRREEGGGRETTRWQRMSSLFQ